MNTIKKKEEYIREIDFLRGFAVLAVIINHFSKDLLPSGYLGVDIFFVISGFVITKSIARNSIALAGFKKIFAYIMFLSI